MTHAGGSNQRCQSSAASSPTPSLAASVELVYDPVLKCYYDPTTNKYYALAQQ